MCKYNAFTIKQNLQVSRLCISEVSRAIPNCIDTINPENHDRYYESPCTCSVKKISITKNRNKPTSIQRFIVFNFGGNVLPENIIIIILHKTSKLRIQTSISKNR